MNLQLTDKKKKQRKVTTMAILITVGFHLMVYLVLRVTGTDKVVMDQVLKMASAMTAPPPPPPPPPPPRANIQAPPKMDMAFKVNQVNMRPTVDAGFDATSLKGFSSGEAGFDLSSNAMAGLGSDAMGTVNATAQLAPMSLAMNMGFDISIQSDDGKRGSVVGSGKRLAGKEVLTFLDLPGSNSQEEGALWKTGELDNISDYISKNTGLKLELGSRSISFMSTYKSFDTWLKKSRERAMSTIKELSVLEPEIDGLNILGSAVPYADAKLYEQFKSRVKKTMTEYLKARYGAMISIENGNWVADVTKVRPPLGWQAEFLAEAEKAFLALYSKNQPDGSELRGLYMLLRMSEIMQLRIILCEPNGVPDNISIENMRFLRTYLANGGFIYFINTASLNNCNGVRGFIRSLTQESISDPQGDLLLAKLRAADRPVNGYNFAVPDPQIFHPWTFLAMTIPQTTNVSVTIYNKLQNVVFADTLKKLSQGLHTQKSKGYKWRAVDNDGNDVEPGYYICQISADLCQKTMPLVVSRLTKLSNKHPLFSAYYPITDVPTSLPLNPSDLPYGEMGVYGYSVKGRMTMCYTEGYMEKEKLKTTGTKDDQQIAALKWVTNVIFYALSEASLAR